MYFCSSFNCFFVTLVKLFDYFDYKQGLLFKNDPNFKRITKDSNDIDEYDKKLQILEMAKLKIEKAKKNKKMSGVKPKKRKVRPNSDFKKYPKI